MVTSQGGAPVTGMLTVYEDQLRFDVAVDSCSHLSNDVDTDETMSCVRLDRQLVNSVDISDTAPLPRPTSRSVSRDLSESFSISKPVTNGYMPRLKHGYN